IMSCSWGEEKPSRALEEVIASTDALFVCAAGNSETDIDKHPYYPASYDLPNVISVAATSPSDNLADFSNYGAKSVDVAAPGVDIYSTWKGQFESDVFWHDSFDSLANWSYIGDWHLDHQKYNTSPSSVCVNLTFQNPSLQNYLVLHTPVNISGYSRPELIFSCEGVILWPTFTKLSVDACVDKKFNWKRIGEWAGAFLSFDDIRCDIPDDMRDSDILVRFIIQEQYPLEGMNKTLQLWIDDVRFSNKTEAYTPSYRYVSGTSMAAPFVAGVAGLVKSEHQNLTPAELREVLIQTVDLKDGLKGKTLSEGRINASLAIRYTPGPDAGVLSLRPGWNQISVPDALETGFDTASIFSQVPSGGHALYSYDPKTGYVRVNETDIIRPLNGYWIYSLSSMDVSLRFQPDPSIRKDLKDGWNLFGLLSEVPVPARDALACLGNNWTMVTGYNASLQWYDEPILREHYSNTSDNRPLVPYQGYWILMNGQGSIP
ncbi:S8 family serine peptidase, partial [Methanospirillum hungatei]|uniref:S8 family serine peptidase n=1 Tax=Methanospirillum hungatei TaxID=2203 RepID=UPI0026EC7999